MKDLIPVGKEGTNQTPGQNYKYKKIEHIYDAVHYACAKNNVTIFLSPEILKREPVVSKSGNKGIHTEIKLTFNLFADDGSTVQHIEYGESIDYGDKGYSKAASNAHKYGLIRIFCIPTEDLDDTDKDTHEVPAKETPIKAEKTTSPYKTVTAVQLTALLGIMSEKRWKKNEVESLIKHRWGLNSLKNMNQESYNWVNETLMKMDWPTAQQKLIDAKYMKPTDALKVET